MMLASMMPQNATSAVFKSPTMKARPNVQLES